MYLSSSNHLSTMRSGGFVFLLLADVAAAVELLSHSLAPFPHYGLGFNLTLQLSEPVLGLEVTWARTDGEGDALRLDVGFDDIDDDDGSSVNYTAVSKDSFVAVELLLRSGGFFNALGRG